MGNRNEYLAYYLQCEGDNPMQATYDEFKAIYHVMGFSAQIEIRGTRPTDWLIAHR